MNSQEWVTAVLDCLFGFMEVLIYDVKPKAINLGGGGGSDSLPPSFASNFLRQTKRVWDAVWEHQTELVSADADRRLRTVEKLAHFVERAHCYT